MIAIDFTRFRRIDIIPVQPTIPVYALPRSRSSRMLLYAFTQARRRLHPILATVTLSPRTRNLAIIVRPVTHASVEMSASVTRM